MSSRSYTDEFKKQAVELARSLGSFSRAASQLGVPKTNIYAWKLRFDKPTENSVTPSVTEPDLHEELKRLRRENSELKQVNVLLKTAAAFFSQDHLKKNIF